VTARTAAGVVVVGTRRLLEEQGVAVPPEAVALLDRLDASGQTALLVARGGVVLGAVGARDRVRPEAGGMLAELRALGINDIALLTGDREAAARAVAADLGLTEVHAELLPQQKAEWVERRGGRVAFVGDGINDAPALARADVGLALGGTGTDVAAEAGDVVFMGDPLRPLPLLVRLSRETVRIIRQNILIFAFAVNGVGILLTAWLWPLLAPPGWYKHSPLAAVVYHQLGSLAVLLNAMRLLWFERPAGPAWLRVRHRLQRIDHWMERRLNPDELLHGLGHHWKPVALGAAAVVLIAWALSGLTQVGPDELAVVRRFGRPLDEDLGPGLHWRWPWPVEEISRVQPDRLRSVEVGFRSAPGGGGMPAALAWSSPHGGDGLRRVTDEAVMITGDGNLVEMQATVRYRIAKPRVYLFDVGDPEGILRAAAEAVLREAVAGRAFSDLLTVDRPAFQKDVLARLDRRCRGYGADGLGVEVESLSVHDLHPPQEVVRAYYDVTRAMEARDKMVIDAQTRRQEKVTAAEAEKAHVVRQAEAARNKLLWDAATDRAIFLARVQVKQRFPELTEFLMRWDARVLVLGGREKLIIDAAKVIGRRLTLYDPDQLPAPPPVMMGPPDRSPFAPRGPGSEGNRQEQ
jgi:Cu+-exporting ATPase